MRKFWTIFALGMVVTVAVLITVRFFMSPNIEKLDSRIPEKRTHEKKSSTFYFPVDELAPTTVVIRINGKAVTQSDYMDWYRLKMDIFRRKNKIKRNKKTKALSDFAKVCRSKMCFDLVRRELFLQYSASNGVALTAARSEKAARTLAMKIGQKNGDLDAIVKEFGDHYGPLLIAAVRDEELMRACVEVSSTNNLLKVSHEEAVAQMERIKAMNKKAKKQNVVQRERALATRQEILAKVSAQSTNVVSDLVNDMMTVSLPGKSEMDFKSNSAVAFATIFAEVTAANADLEKDDGEEWDTLELGELQADDELAKWLMTAKPGDISEPLDMDDGLAIVGLKSKYMGEAPEGIKPQMQHEVVRCTFFAYEEYEEPDSLDELIKIMLEERRRKATTALVNNLINGAKIDYPLGEEIFKHVRRKRPDAGKLKRSSPKKMKN